MKVRRSVVLRPALPRERKPCTIAGLGCQEADCRYFQSGGRCGWRLLRTERFLRKR